jgi:peroxiredoxin
VPQRLPSQAHGSQEEFMRSIICILTLSSLALIPALSVAAEAGKASAPVQKATIGQKAPGFTLKDAVQGKTHSLSQTLRTKGTRAAVIMFIATDCPISNDYNKRMVAIAKEYTPKGVQFLGINPNHTEPVDRIVAHAKQNGFPFPVLRDEGNKIADIYDAQFTPEIYVVDSKGILRYRGRIDDSQNPTGVKVRDLDAALKAILAGQPVERNNTKAFGCTIKRVARS